MRTFDFVIRPAQASEHEAIARLWMDSWVSTGLDTASDVLLNKLTARIPREIDGGWSLFVADDGRRLAAMLAINIPKKYLDQLFVAPEYQGRSIGRRLLAFTRTQLPHEIWLRCALKNEKAWRWYEREGFAFEREDISPENGLTMKCYRWTRQA